MQRIQFIAVQAGHNDLATLTANTGVKDARGKPVILPTSDFIQLATTSVGRLLEGFPKRKAPRSAVWLGPGHFACRAPYTAYSNYAISSKSTVDFASFQVHAALPRFAKAGYFNHAAGGAFVVPCPPVAQSGVLHTGNTPRWAAYRLGVTLASAMSLCAVKAEIPLASVKFFDGNRLGTPITFTAKFKASTFVPPGQLSMPIGEIPASVAQFPGLLPKVAIHPFFDLSIFVEYTPFFCSVSFPFPIFFFFESNSTGFYCVCLI